MFIENSILEIKFEGGKVKHDKYLRNPFPCKKSWKDMFQSLKHCWGKMGKPRRYSRKDSLEGFLRVSLGLNVFSVREEMLIPWSIIRCHKCSSGKVLAFAN